MSENKIDLNTLQGQITSKAVSKIELRIAKLKDKIKDLINLEVAETKGSSPYYTEHLVITLYELDKICSADGNGKRINVGKLLDVIGEKVFEAVVDVELRKASARVLEYSDKIKELEDKIKKLDERTIKL